MVDKNEEIPEEVSLEYQKAQDSAEHFNTMIWQLISILLVSSIIILYTYLNIEDYFQKILLLGAGLVILLYFSFIIESAHNNKILKYYICKKLNRDINL